MKVLLLKNKTAQLDKYEVLFKENGFEPVFIPLITHNHVPGNLLQLIKEPSYMAKLQNIIITSQRTVECLSESVLPYLNPPVKEALLSKTVYTVGPSTKEFLLRIGFKTVKGGKDAGNGSILADIITSDLLTGTNDNKIFEILFLVGEIRRDIIPKKLSSRDIKVREVVTYKTKDLDDNIDRFKSALSQDSWVVLFSPQGTREILEYLKTRKGENVKLASIGPTTEKFLQENGIEPQVVSAKPDACSLFNAIHSFV